MKISEAAMLLGTAAAFDRREVSELDAGAWHAALAAAGLADLELKDAEAAVIDHYSKTRDWLMPADVIGYCKRIRRERVAAAGSIEALITADPDDPAAYAAERKRLTAEIASGRRNARGELEAGR